jgi:hypothetical protein
MTDTATASPPPSVETHDPLPEANWFWRRVFSFLFVSLMIAGMWWIGSMIDELAPHNPNLAIEKLYDAFRYAVLLTFVSVTYYMVAPSAEQVTRMWQTAALFKNGVVSSVTQVAKGADGSTASATTVTGQAGSTTPAAAPASSAAAYAGPPAEHIPPADPSVPEEPTWPK